MAKVNIYLIVILVFFALVVISWYVGILPFLLGTAQGLLIVNFIYYLALFFASLIASLLVRRAFGPYISEIIERVRKRIKI
ncbi:MAG: hypothetical protein QXL14_01350 [Candidatus Aenigmatarchaeota archaeon]